MLDSAELTAAGAVRPITQYGDPVLSTRCREVTEFGPDLQQLVADLFASMYAARGVGLAANQIGVDQRVFVLDCPDDEVGRMVGHVVNPVLELTPEDDEYSTLDEGCLSVRGPRAEVTRLRHATVRGVDYTGAPVELVGVGVSARCFQHETDHLNGRLYLSKLTDEQREAVLTEFEQLRSAGAPVDGVPVGGVPVDGVSAFRAGRHRAPDPDEDLADDPTVGVDRS